MKESALNRDEKTGGLSGMSNPLGGVLPSMPRVPAGLTGVTMPESLVGVRLEGDKPVGLKLPGLAEREVVAAWRAELGGGPLYVRCQERSEPLPIAQVQRLARMGELWLDCAVPDEAVALDLMVAGAHRVVIWPEEQENLRDVLDSLGDSAVLGWNGKPATPDVVELAHEFLLPLLVSADSPETSGLHVYQVDPYAKGKFTVHRIREPEPEVELKPVEKDSPEKSTDSA